LSAASKGGAVLDVTVDVLDDDDGVIDRSRWRYAPSVIAVARLKLSRYIAANEPSSQRNGDATLPPKSCARTTE
jgi:hypothetical protein